MAAIEGDLPSRYTAVLSSLETEESVGLSSRQTPRLAAALAVLAVLLAATSPAHSESLAHGPLEGRVFGYLPYWEFDTARLRWELLSDLAFFSVGVDAAGNVTEDRGWGGTFSEELRTAAALHGVRFVLTITNFSNEQIDDICASESSRSVVIGTILGLLADGGAESVNLDFEHVPGSARAGFVDFVRELRAALRAQWPDGEVTIAMPKIDWWDGYDLAALADAADGLMVMAYGYHWKGGPPGPLTPIFCGTAWPYCLDEDTVPDYLAAAPGMLARKVWIGLPLYGYDWPADGPDPGAASRGNATYLPVSDCMEQPFEAWSLGPLGEDLYRSYQGADGWHQVWCDDPASFDRKLDYILGLGFGGIGLWALGYDGERDDFWVQIADRMTHEPPPPDDNAAPLAVVGPDQTVRLPARVVLDGGSSWDPDGDELSYRWTQISGPAVRLGDVRSARPFFDAAVAGEHRFQLVVDDGALRSLPAFTSVFVSHGAVSELRDAGGRDELGGGDGARELASDDLVGSLPPEAAPDGDADAELTGDREKNSAASCACAIPSLPGPGPVVIWFGALFALRVATRFAYPRPGPIRAIASS